MDEIKDSLIVVVTPEDGDPRDEIFSLEELSLSFDDDTTKILNAIQPMVLEKFGVNIKDEDDSWLYKVVKSPDNNNIHIIPNSTAGQ